MENLDIKPDNKSLPQPEAHRPSLVARILAQIKNNKLAPKPRWRFLLKNYMVWLSGVAALLVGAAAVSVMIYLFKYNDWEVCRQTHKSLAEFFLLTLPYFWLLFLGFFVFVIYYNLKHTKHGYRYPLYALILVSVAASIILGSGFFLMGWGEKIDDILGRRMPFYGQVMNRQMAFWFNPEEGRLTGIVVDLPDERGYFYLVDPVGGNWQILSLRDRRRPEFLLEGQPVNLIGQVLSDYQFQAEMVRPLISGKEFLRKKHSCPNNACPFSRDRFPQFGPPPLPTF